MTDNEMVRWHHLLNGHQYEQTPGNGERQGSLACCSPCRRKESDVTERLNKKQQHGKITTMIPNVSPSISHEVIGPDAMILVF